MSTRTIQTAAAPIGANPLVALLAWIVLLVAGLVPAGPARADALKDEAIARLAHSHDPEVPIAIGRVYLKQVTLRAARALLARRGRAAGLGNAWNANVPAWQEAEARLVETGRAIVIERVDNPAWLHEAWGREAARVLNAEEADEIATHFETPGGRDQRTVIELLLVGETVMANYTMTNRLEYGLSGSRDEMTHLQTVWWKHDPLTPRDFTRDAATMRFATRDPGVKYAKMLAFHGVGAVIAHLDQVAGEITAAVDAQSTIADEAVERFRAR